MKDPLNDAALDQIWREARTFNGWQDKPVPAELLQKVYDLAKWGPTSANCSPMRVKFIAGPGAKERLRPFVNKGNLEKTMAAPATAIFAFDYEFYENLPKLFPHTDAKSWFVGKPDYIKETAWRNGTLQAGYFILAARAMGLDCGPMSGFDAEGVKKEFFPDQNVQVNFLCNLGYGDPASLYPRNPRLDFDEVCEIL